MHGFPRRSKGAPTGYTPRAMALRWNDAEHTVHLGLRDALDLCRRDLGPGAGRAGRGLAMSGGARLLAGRRLHAEVQAGWEGEEDPVAEVPLQWTTIVRGWACTVSGRVDGLGEEDGRLVIEELKSTALDAEGLDVTTGFPAWEDQLALYVYMATQTHRREACGRLRVVSLVDGSERLVHVAAADAWGEKLRRYLDALVYERERWLAWQTRRREAPVRFAWETAREGQEEMRAAVNDAVEGGQHLLLVAPTGIGKTAAVLHGVLAATARSGCGVYWATARTTQQVMVERTAREMITRGTPLRVVTLRAREKACSRTVGPGGRVVVDCRAEACPASAGYRDRAPTALEHLPFPGLADAEAVRAEAGRMMVCPYELAVDAGRTADLVIGDYNPCFDPAMPLKRLFGERPWVLVVDEAHQLPERAMGYGSPSLPLALAEAAVASTRRPGFDALYPLAVEIRDEIAETGLRAEEVIPVESGEAGGATGELLVEVSRARWRDLRERVDEVAIDHARLRSRAGPPLLDDADLDSVDFGAAPDELSEDPWHTLSQAVFRFVDTLERAGEETVALWSPPGIPGAEPGLRLYCRDPSGILGPRFAEAAASVSMSATLYPTWFQRDRCGLDPARVRELRIPSPFPPEHRRVQVVGGVSTTWKDRDKERGRLTTLLDTLVAEVPGNVVIYFASYAQLRDLCANATLGGRERLTQSADATDAERATLLAELEAEGPPRVLLAVLGGAFAEGIDIPNRALQAAIIVGPALPPPSVERALLQQWYEERYDEGFTLAYVHPGMTRVVQAAGRVVRGPEDRGRVVLVCRRFLRHEYQAWLPPDWNVERRR